MNFSLKITFKMHQLIENVSSLLSNFIATKSIPRLFLSHARDFHPIAKIQLRCGNECQERQRAGEKVKISSHVFLSSYRNFLNLLKADIYDFPKTAKNTPNECS